MHLCTSQEAPSGPVASVSLVFLHSLVEYSLDSERMASRAQEKRGQSKTVPANSHCHKIGFCACLCALAIVGSHVGLQQWEERATVTNSFAATKVAGNLSNGTIKLQLSFFSFFIADAWISEATSDPTFKSQTGSLHISCTLKPHRQIIYIYIAFWLDLIIRYRRTLSQRSFSQVLN